MRKKLTTRIAMTSAVIAGLGGVLAPTPAQAAPTATTTAATTASPLTAAPAETVRVLQEWGDWTVGPRAYLTKAAATTGVIAAIHRLRQLGYQNQYDWQVYTRSEWLGGTLRVYWHYRFRYWG